MAWDALKQSLLKDLAKRIEKRSDVAHRQSLHNLAAVFLSRFAAEDMRGRSVENLYGCLYGLLRFMHSWDKPEPKVRIFNPELQGHGWESKYTVVAVLCRDMPFCTASVRGELNRRNIRIHTLASCNVVTERDSDNALLSVVDDQEREDDSVSQESLLYFEIGRHSNPEELEQLRSTLTAILSEVALVVDDFQEMRQRLDETSSLVEASKCIDASNREEALAFCQWLRQDHMTFLGYEYLSVQRSGPGFEVKVQDELSLGLLRERTTHGVKDLISDLNTMSPEELQRRQLSFSKSSLRSRVHRLAYPDYVEIKAYNDQGEVIGQHRFIGLFTSTVYTMNPSLIPILRRKVEQVMELSGLEYDEHDGRELMRVLELFPRDELFQSSVRELYDTVVAVNQIQERRQTRLFVRKDVHAKFVNCLVYMPRDRYNTEQRVKMQNILSSAFGAEESEFTTHFTESILVRCHYVLRVDPSNPRDYDVNEIEEQIVQATLAWEDRLRIRLVEEFGEEQGEHLARNIGSGFPPGYRDDFDPRVALMDIRQILSLKPGNELVLRLYRLLEEGDEKLRLRIYHSGDSLPLSDIMPILENLGLRVVSERPYGVRAADSKRYWIQEFSLIYSLVKNIDLEQVRDDFEEAFTRIWFGEAENDSFNRLLLGTQLTWREIALLRAYARYLRQIQFSYSVEYIAETMANHLSLTDHVMELFLTRFSPVFDGDEGWRAQREEIVEKRILDALEQVENLSEDRVIRQFIAVIKATLRTNFFQEGESGKLKPYFSFKLNPQAIPDMPAPVPMYEIFVYSPRVEGVHLRGGKVARGGLRWSDRQEDFRTEVLGLVKAQQVKNSVIVPVGAKGGFVAKALSADMSRDEIQQEGIECYKMFIRGLLDITDNRVESGIQRPSQVVAKDDEDPYMVVAADKGTATFSDIANGIAAEYDFWLGDAFASGGSVGYDHKKMGITARGAWVSVQRHFREIGIDVQNEDFTVVGIGDMGGDVFGNGMLRSKHIRLLAAFNHMHIFVDPDPDAATSYTERERLFKLPRSSWADYNSELISAGGGIFNRSAKSVVISPQMKACFDIEEDHLTPNDLISRILQARVDLLWNGGIGTYVKSSLESHMDVGDKANDGVRVNANRLRCRIIGEGGNLGMTQLSRVEYCLGGGRSNTDFIDNAGGVDCSDHEVNIKILLNAIVARGDLTEKHRNELLEQMTDSVTQLVLKNNYRQTQAISLAEHQALDRSGEYQRFISDLESAGRLSRELEFIPSDEELAERRGHGKGLTRPELAILVSYSKSMLKEELIASDLGVDPHLSHSVASAFPSELVERYGEELLEHRLHREILCTQVANDIVNRMGLTFVERQRKATGASVADVARAYTAIMEVYAIAKLWDEIEALDNQVDAKVQLDMMLHLIRLVRRAVRWLLRNRRHQLAPSASIAEFGEGVAVLRQSIPDLLQGRLLQQYQVLESHYREAGVSEDLARQVASAVQSYTALGIIQASSETAAPLRQVAELYFYLGEKLELDWFSGQILSSKINNEWQAMARDTYLEDLEWQQRTLAVGALRHMDDQGDVEACIGQWAEQEAVLLKRWREMLNELHTTTAPDFAMFAVANRELLDLAQSSVRG
ncbi:NAD-glutamate dehydrogenase [Parahaliea sp. F7430]|uniref:NAD-glutamate dehydrogenase n=1 Tax=Sediminihaliea albiluteola TaxID=2758564 RepID=A0A7W2TU93_9GAMM|nr:NAD-glutamate dehydrogenase [Sediminihaliea albiluteola]MBA6411988.1 NAD-glutamate dehydrogenase [Sediminihaliea albiluteola]